MKPDKFGVATRRAALRRRVIAHMGGRCRICGYDRCDAAMDLHHLDPTEKDFSISSVTSWKRIVPELLKCVLLCCRCHREVHDGLHPGYLTDADALRGQVPWGEEDEDRPQIDEEDSALRSPSDAPARSRG
jgi:hypothetical protein